MQTSTGLSSSDRARDILRELMLRANRTFDLKAFCHSAQYAFVADRAAYATAVTSRRAGKTVACAADLLDTALRFPGSVGLYITLSRSNAKILLWPIIKDINRRNSLGGEANESDLSIHFTNGSTIYLSGVKDASEINKFRGMALKTVYLDEAQSMRPYIEELIDDVLDPALIDHAGKMRVIGTPGAVPVGYFRNVSTSPEWSHHHFTIWDNPFILNARERLELVLKRRGISEDHPSIQREWFGRWVLDLESLVIKYDKSKNDYTELPTGLSWDYVLAADLGFEDADAIAVLGFSRSIPDVYLVEEFIRTKQGITELADKINSLIDKYEPIRVVGDFGGLGKKIAEEMRLRFGIPIGAADKHRKLEFIELLNDALRTGRFRAKSDSRFAQDSLLLEWEIDYEKQKRDISPRYHSDIIDAVLYGFRECLHFLYEPVQHKPERGSLAESIRQEDEHIAQLEQWHAEKEAEKRYWSETPDW